jgi:hypothetical protein
MSAPADLLRAVTRRRRPTLAEWTEVLAAADRVVASWRGSRVQLADSLAWLADLPDASSSGDAGPAMPPSLDPIAGLVESYVGLPVVALVAGRPWLERDAADALRVRAKEAGHV